MATTTAQNLREKTSQELQDQLLLEKKRIFDGIVRGASGEAIKPHEKRQGRRLIARIQTVLRERELRKGLERRLPDLAREAAGASAQFATVVKKVEQRLAEIKAELGKPAGQRQDKPMPRRVRERHCKLTPSQRRSTPLPARVPGERRRLVELTPADRAAVGLAEAKRLQAALERTDMGEGK